MPQASDELRARWADDGEAWDQLKGRFTDSRGLIRPKPGVVPTADDLSALDYLCGEWDYAYDPSPIKAKPSAWCRLTERPIYTDADGRPTYEQP